MPSYVIGDVQGCFDELMLLLEKINFNSKNDELIFAGDLINRGPKSLEVLEFCLKNKKSIEVVLGNHDIYLLYLIHQNKKNFQLAPILESKNKKKFFNWLIEKPLMIERKNNKNEKFVISHAGIPHIWDIEDARMLNEEYLNAIKRILVAFLEICGEITLIYGQKSKRI